MQNDFINNSEKDGDKELIEKYKLKIEELAKLLISNSIPFDLSLNELDSELEDKLFKNDNSEMVSRV